MLPSIQDYYRQPGLLSHPKQHIGLLACLPPEVPALRDALQGLFVHVFWAQRYGLELDDARKSEVQIRPAWRKIDRLLELNPQPLWQPRPLEQRLVCNCRDISLLMVSLLMAHGIPARARCGFGTYFMPNHYEDHWVVEYWRPGEDRWVMVDAQLDATQREVLGIGFEPLDMPPGKFVTGGQAWQMCRSGQADPDTFGIFDIKGWNFVRGNVVRDFLALNKVEVLPWDFWGVLLKPWEELSAEDLAYVDRLALLANRPGEESFAAVREEYEQNSGLHIPPEWAS